MSDWIGKRYWLVGASEGLGRAVAMKLSKVGAEVVVSARSEDRLAELCAELPGISSFVTCDVSDREDVARAAEKVGQIDGMIYLAGVYWPQSAVDWNADEVEKMCDINFTGAARVVGQIIGDMVARNAGHIVVTGSLSGFRGLPGAIGYGASKAGLMYLAESMYADLRGTGVRVQVVNPGFIKTRLTAKNDFKMPFIMDADAAANEMFEHMNDDAFKKSFPLGFGLMFRLSQLLPDWLYYRTLGRGS
jgi:NADP-dependent 3-hydroxy acid dehydrogenase YdfG